MTRRRMPLTILKCCSRLVATYIPQRQAECALIHGRIRNDITQQVQKRTANGGRYCLPMCFHRFVPCHVLNY